MSIIETVFLSPNPDKQYHQIDQRLANRASFFGDGIFETMIFSNGKIRFAHAHEERLNIGLEKLKIYPKGLSSLKQLEGFLIKEYGKDCMLRIRWNVFRSGLGKYTPQQSATGEIIMIQAHSPGFSVKDQAYISTSIKISSSPWANCKTLNALPYVMANIERVEKHMDEVILLDDQNHISEAGAANIFWVKDGEFHTPSLNCNCIAGVGRKMIIETIKKAGKKLNIGEYNEESLLSAEQVFTSNVTGIAYIKKIKETDFDIKPISFIENIFY
ncbi:aminotransferase class IV [Echinicola marina]|uniref:aminotransferase class IV n=1 Tax=Echinicola marina TaxID=2859768 RepID=UPI001CF6335A|nr:aminotransferase class IV [Echinicola marina]UCS91899.1 aminotransferase class IV [Echinicola marina]